MARRIDGRNALDVDDLEQLHKVLDVDVIELLRRAANMEVTAYSLTSVPAAPHAVDVRSPRSRARARSRFAQATAA